jgi:hypothetical protein
VARCHMGQTVFGQCCEARDGQGDVGFLWFMKPSMVEPTVCQAANQTNVLKIAEMDYKVEWGVTQSHK